MPWNERVFMILIGVIVAVFLLTVLISLQILKKKANGEFDLKKYGKKISIIESVILISFSIFLIFELILLFRTGNSEYLIDALLSVGIIIPSIIIYRKFAKNRRSIDEQDKS